MVMGNYMTLSGIHPKEMYNWFMEFAMDSYDWVMILNVFAMAGHADAKKDPPTFTKPYVSSDNYIEKMSHYKEKDNTNSSHSWKDDWKEKYYSFLKKHKKIFKDNPRMNLMMRNI